MKLTAFSDIALRVLLLMGGLPGGTLLSTQRIAEGVGAPYHHVTKTVAKLRSMGLLASQRGRAGGVILTESGLAASLGSVLRELEANTAIVECEADETSCPLNHGCKLRGALARAREAFYRELDGVTIADLVNERQVGRVAVTIGLVPPSDAFA
ncbi:Rrf2 family transcriptional regulator [Kocuria sp. WRN011]|uniref:Rrf2 family transcriptional regulator n=1 Tax=Kocuria carniphila TaxID=262208 RepID=A0ABV3V0C3_9MICC|nr:MULTISPECIES: Rrf2 family transcriptional regulator [Kocuria]MCT1801946.1 Rrf2 family transcriptional regulator [Kocuria carniphila]PBB09631.1 Rrf2 family transcriptional regulator [Kocuria sp. WRN011]PZP37402.1 MAG: Rrf2 family transcriptional regulator [Kocuria rhizophila]